MFTYSLPFSKVSEKIFIIVDKKPEKRYSSYGK